jgi:hypothetical protein
MMARKDGSMAEFEFESRLDKMFGEAQAFDDATPFAVRVQSKLNRRWLTRGLVIGTFGVIGGVIGVGQIVGSGMLDRLGAMNASAVHVAAGNLTRWTTDHLQVMTPPNGFAGGAWWVVLGAAGVAVAWLVTRLVEDI